MAAASRMEILGGSARAEGGPTRNHRQGVVLAAATGAAPDPKRRQLGREQRAEELPAARLMALDLKQSRGARGENGTGTAVAVTWGTLTLALIPCWTPMG